jgi:hypothetical protein
MPKRSQGWPWRLNLTCSCEGNVEAMQIQTQTRFVQRSLKMVALFAENVCSIIAAMLAKIAALD